MASVPPREARGRTLFGVFTVAALLLAGCTGPRDGADDAARSPRPTFTATPDGVLTLEAPVLPALVERGTTANWTFLVRHGGDPGEGTVSYAEGCPGAWSYALRGPEGGAADWQGPAPLCPQADSGRLSGGQTVSVTWSWDGTVWDGGGRVDARTGPYTITVAFEARDADGAPIRPTGHTTVTVR